MASVDIILGCMYSGKTTELIRRMERFRAINKNVLCINHVFDVRCEEFIKTHNGMSIPAIKTDNLNEVLSTDVYKEAVVIGIDEAQFFNGLRKFVLECERDGKNVIISGLDGDYEREPMGEILSCIPLCDTVIKLKAYDMVDCNGTYGIFTKRISDEKEKVVIGSMEKYISVSRKNY